MVAKSLREWYELYNPEFSRSVEDHEKFAELITTKTKEQLLNEINLTKLESMGAELEQKDLTPILKLAKELKGLYELKEQQIKYLESVMESYCPNLTALAGALIGANLLRIAGSLQKLAMFPASTIQLLGAEKALFRHLRSGARSPKYGIIINHPFVINAPKEKKVKIARSLAGKIVIAIKVDLFKGQFIGDKLRQEVLR
jgi:nucleolar protein 56